MSTHIALKQLSNHIVFRLLHYTYIAMQLRQELVRTLPGGKSQATVLYRECQPLVLWLTNVLLTFAGDILVNMLLGHLPLEPLGNGEDILLCTLSWYLVFYSPFDGVHTLAHTLLFRILAAPVTAISQVLHIDRGVQLAGRVYGRNAMVPILIVGTVIGSGAEFLKPIAALLINRCQQSNSAYVKLSTNSKVSLLISWLYLLQLNRSRLLFDLGQRHLHIYVLLALIAFKFLALAYRIDHLICLLERRLCYAFFGGLYADLNKFWQQKSAVFRRHISLAKFD
ncbi:hypothetical protein KR222_005384 [Zaprionus bogoriensis]|nr:hypothetical protein KR222_005384 [Zaprionus bogoriensis]